MIAENNIVIQSAGGAPVSNLYIRAAQPGRRLVVIFPGGNYTCERPLLRYATNAALQTGYDAVNLRYYCQGSGQSYEDGPDVRRQIIRDSAAVLRECLRACDYEKISFVSKSIGTVLAGEVSLLFPERDISNFFLTPLAETIPFITKSPCTVAAGDRDWALSAADIARIRELPGVTVRIIPDVGHSLEKDDDCLYSLAVLTDVTRMLLGFYEARAGRRT